MVDLCCRAAHLCSLMKVFPGRVSTGKRFFSVSLLFYYYFDHILSLKDQTEPSNQPTQLRKFTRVLICSCFRIAKIHSMCNNGRL